MAKYTLQQIRDYWEQQALKHKQSHEASWSDKPIIEMEIREILKHLDHGDRVLDVGCANGYSTIQFAVQKEIRILGVDYLPGMIQYAREQVDRMRDKLRRGSIEFAVADIMALEQADETYDKVIVKRVITNLGEYSRQQKGIHECIRVLKPGGLLLLSDATLQGWEKMNQFRNEWHLPDIPMPSFNNYLDREQIIKDFSQELELIEISNFSSTYYVGTRVLKPLLIRALGIDIDVADPGMEWNRWFSQLPSWGDYGTQELFLFKKK